MLTLAVVLITWAAVCPVMLRLADVLARPYETVCTRSAPGNLIACVTPGAAFVLAAFKFPDPLQMAIMLAFMTTLVLLGIIDARLNVLPSKVTVPLFLVGLVKSQ